MPLYAGLVAIGFWLAAGSVQRAFTSHLSRRRELLEALTTGLGRVCVGGSMTYAAWTFGGPAGPLVTASVAVAAAAHYGYGGADLRRAWQRAGSR